MLRILLTLKKLNSVVSNQTVNLKERFLDQLEQIVLQ